VKQKRERTSFVLQEKTFLNVQIKNSSPFLTTKQTNGRKYSTNFFVHIFHARRISVLHHHPNDHFVSKKKSDWMKLAFSDLKNPYFNLAGRLYE
jgi:hypothetical protein